MRQYRLKAAYIEAAPDAYGEYAVKINGVVMRASVNAHVWEALFEPKSPPHSVAEKDDDDA